MLRHPLDPVFSPESIAIVGASDRPGSLGQVVLEMLRAGGYRGAIFAINPNHASVSGLPCYPNLRALGRPVDLALIAVNARFVPDIMEDCGQAGVRSAIVFSAGFAECGPDGVARQQQLVAIARRHGVRLVGPNCIGVVRPRAQLHAFFGRSLARPGRLALVSQSGALCTAILDWAEAHGIGFSAVVSVGAAADVGFGEVLDFLALDEQTDAVLLYVEGADHARRFMSGLRVAARMKPVIALKAGRRPEGSRAAASHTGAMIGDDAVFDSALRRAGAVRAGTLEQLFAAAELLASGRRTRGNRLAIVTNAGGLGVMAADRVSEREVALAKLSPDTLQALDAVLPAHWSHGNPVDLIGDAPPERYAAALAPVIADAGVDGALLLLSPQAMTAPLEVAKHAIDAEARTPKPVLACLLGGAQVRPARALLTEHGVPELPSPEAAVDAFGYLASFERNQRMLLEVPGPLWHSTPPDVPRARAVIERARAEGRAQLSIVESKEILSAFGIAVSVSERAASAEQAAAAAERMGMPVAMKIDSPDITHKSDVGGVRLGLVGREAVREAFERMTAQAAARKPGARIAGVTIEPMHAKTHARELIAGIGRDAAFGPVITFGAGGTLVELIGDRSLALPPLNAGMAHDMIERTRVRRLLGELRGAPPADREALEHVLLRLSELACELPEVRELDINPLVVDEHGALAVDARVIVGDEHAEAGARRYAHMAIEPYPAHLTRTIVVDGATLILRPIRPEDAAIERSFVHDLSFESRYFRFHHGLAELTPQMLVRFTQIDYDREMAFVAVHERDGGEEEVGVSRYVTDPDGQGCEFALAVADAWQGIGVGTALMQALIERARQKGLAHIHGEVLAQNGKMLELSRVLGFHIGSSAGGPTLKSVTLDLNAGPPHA